MRQVQARVKGMTWHYSNSIFAYNYAMEDAPWVKKRVAHDLAMPQYLTDFLAAEVQQYAPIQVTDATTVVTLAPRIVTWEMEQLATGPYNFSVRVAWFKSADDHEPHFSTRYYVEHSADFLTSHEAHRAAVEAAIPASLVNLGPMPHDLHRLAGPIPMGNPLKHPQSKGS
jgi:hypothetical protein